MLPRSVGVWCCVAFLVGMLLPQVFTWTAPLIPTALPSPQLTARACYISRATPREPWQPVVDGIVVFAGHQHYLVMSFAEAERRGGQKIGMTEPIVEFDRTYTEATCPKGWRTK